MTDLQVDLEAIVREVLRRLERQLSSAPPAAPAPPPPPAESGPPLPAPPSAAESLRLAQLPRRPTPVRIPGTLEIRERVVTLSGLKDRLTGVKVLLVPPGAVVTPSARDELRKRNIRLETATAPVAAAAAADPGLLVAIVSGGQSVATIVRAIAAEAGQVRQVGGGELVETIGQLSQAMLAERLPAVLVTGDPAAAVCLANRQAGLRAAWAAGPLLTERACRSIGANLLVLDPTAQPAHEVRPLVRQFLQAGHQCPAQWKAALE